MNKRLTIIVGVVILGLLVPAVPTIKAQNNKIADKTTDKSSCEYQVTFINYRSKILEKYKKKEEKTFYKDKEKWQSRISYSSQWVPKDAQKAKTSLDRYQKQHETLIKEVNDQIQDYSKYEYSPLSCAGENRTETEKRIVDMKGANLKKSGGKQKKIEDKKKELTKLRNGDFKKDTDGMIKKLHGKKKKNPAPLFQKSVF